MKKILLLISHLVFAAIGFGLGIYALPILTAPDAPSTAEMKMATAQATFKGEFKRDLAGSYFLHWGEGTISIGEKFISLNEKVAAGPDYKLYLSPKFVEIEAEFNQAKTTMIRVGDVKTFENFVIPVADDIDPSQYNTIIIWCEAFGEFITAAKYQW
ncbi:MAG: hypothetical protein ACI88H_002223 [Cocleimonas sp.]|jgi:hypothetical protein